MPTMNSKLQLLQAYPFEKLQALKHGIDPPQELPHIALSIGEPKHTPPQFVLDNFADNLSKFAQYPVTKGLPELREAIAQWATQRFHLMPDTLTAEAHVLPVAGTREALFSFIQASVTHSSNVDVVMPNPFYQIYEGAALLAGARPRFLNCTEEQNFLPSFDTVPEHIWEECQVLFICTPGNPTGTVMSIEQLKHLIVLADEYDFIIASDECYSELYFDEANPPPGLLQACAELGRNDYSRCIVFHSLSKRSNLPGLRSGFVAGDANILEAYLRYRTYEGCALPIPTQLASIAAWQDEAHVLDNRNQYREKFNAVTPLLQTYFDIKLPDGGFYFWLPTPISDTDFARELYREQNVTVLPGQYLARKNEGTNPGENRVRIALVATQEECLTAAQRICSFMAARV